MEVCVTHGANQATMVLDQYVGDTARAVRLTVVHIAERHLAVIDVILGTLLNFFFMFTLRTRVACNDFVTAFFTQTIFYTAYCIYKITCQHFVRVLNLFTDLFSRVICKKTEQLFLNIFTKESSL